MTKRTNGEGSIRRRSDGRWEARIMDGYREDGKPQIRYYYGKTKKEVREKLDSYLANQASGLTLERDYIFRDWAQIWYEHHRDNITPTTQENYRYTLKLLNAHFGNRRLCEIKAFDVEQFLKKLRKEQRSDSCLAQSRAMLYMIFHKAVANDLMHKNPVAYADKLRSRGPKKRKDAFTAEEVKLLMCKLPQDKMGISIRLMLGTGMRAQEVLALEPRFIAEDGSIIYIRQAINMVKGTVTVGLPKSQKSSRDIPVPPNLRYCAVRLRNTKDTYIWESPKNKGQPVNPSWFRDKFKSAISQIDGVRVLTPHSCRHTYVSQLQALGVSLETIQSIVGHADVDMTQYYLHIQESVRQDAVNRFAEAFQVQVDVLD